MHARSRCSTVTQTATPACSDSLVACTTAYIRLKVHDKAQKYATGLHSFITPVWLLQELDVAPSELLPTPGATPPSAGVVTPPIVPTTTTNTTTTDDGTTTITTGDGTTATTDEAGTSETSPNSATDEDATLTAAPGSDGEAGSISEPSASDSSEAVTAGDVVDRGQSNTGLVVGCAVGGAVVLLAVIAGLFLLGKRRGTRDEEDPFPAATSHVVCCCCTTAVICRAVWYAKIVWIVCFVYCWSLVLSCEVER